MAKINIKSMQEGMFRYIAWVPSHKLHWDEKLRLAEGWVEGHPLLRKPGLLEAPWLVDPFVKFGMPIEGKVSFPFQRADLFRHFAHLPLTHEAVGKFANTYGFLGSPILLCYPAGTTQGENTLQLGESFHFWKEEIEQMRFLLELWDAVRSAEQGGSVGTLARRIVWSCPGEPLDVMLKYSPDGNPALGGVIIASEKIGLDVGILKQWKHNDLINPTRYYLGEQIDAELKGHMNLRVSHDEVYMELDSLLSALYLPFKWEVSGKRAIKICVGCGNQFTPSRRDQIYCNKKCVELTSYHRNKGRKKVSKDNDGS